MIYTIFDIETNGLIEKSRFPEVLEVGYIQVNEALELLRGGSFYFYKPEWKLRRDAQGKHGLTAEFLEAHENEYNESLVKLWTFMQHGRLIGKNSDRFDIPCCKNMFSIPNVGLGLPVIDESADIQKVWAPVYRELIQKFTGKSVKNAGTLEEYVMLLGLKQETVAEKFRETFPDEARVREHSALYDAYMTYLVALDAKKRGILNLEVSR